MALLDLPPELLLLILDYLGAGFFRGDIIRRLTVSKKWFDLAWRILARDLRLTGRSVGRFPKNSKAIERSQRNIVAVGLYLKSYECPSPSSSEDPPQSVFGDADASSSRLNSSLVKLATTLQRCPGTRSLVVEVRALGLHCWGFLMAKPLADLLSLRHMTSGEFDTASCYLTQARVSGVHLCRSINALLPSLRRLRCRRLRLDCVSLG